MRSGPAAFTVRNREFPASPSNNVTVSTAAALRRKELFFKCFVSLLRSTVPPFIRTQRWELLSRHNFHLRPHGIMSRSTKLAARSFIHASSGKLQLRLTHRARQHFHVVTRSLNRK